ncbi:MAG: transporter substrate-binding domain-containing protein [Cyanobacteria bacterium J06635_1]
MCPSLRFTESPAPESSTTASNPKAEGAFTVEAGYLHIVASDFDARPMSYVTAEGYRTGYEPELARLVCKRLRLTPVWHNLPMAEFYTSFDTGHYDVMWFNQAITPERQQILNFTRPYGLFDEAVLVKADSAISSPNDLSGKRVGGLADSTNIALVEGFSDAEAIPYPGSDKVLPEMLAALRAGEIDALIDDELVLLVAAEEDPALKLAFSLPTQAAFAIGLPKKRDVLLRKLEDTLTDILADGTLAKLWADWIPWKPFPFS